MATNTSFAYTAYFPIFRDRIASLVNVSSMRDGSTRPVPFRCLWDTGASISLVSPRVADTLRLDVLDESITIRTGLGSRSKVDIRMAYLHVVLGAIPLPLKVGVVDMPSSDTDIDVVLGLDLISQGSFAISYDGGQLLFSFCYPPRAAPAGFHLDAPDARPLPGNTCMHSSRQCRPGARLRHLGQRAPRPVQRYVDGNPQRLTTFLRYGEFVVNCG